MLLLVTSPVTYASTVDWTPYLISMQNGCVYDDTYKTLSKKLPANLQKTVVRKTGVLSHENNTLTLILKNATAFGAPLTKIRFHGESYSPALSLHFANDKFVNAVSDFYVKDLNGKKHYMIAGINKDWLEEVEPSVVNGVEGYKVYRVVQLNRKQAMAFWDPADSDEGYQYRVLEQSFMTGYSLSPSGYTYGGPWTNTKLTVDKKAKTITCETTYQ